MNLEAALDSLYAAPPEEFLATRKKLAKEVNPTIGSRRKPTTAAYVLNQLARRHAKDVESLVDVGRELARAQRRGEGLREAIEKQRSTVELVTKDAALVMHEVGVDPSVHLDAVAAAIHAALVDPATGAALEEGRLEKAPELGGSFPEIEVKRNKRAETEARRAAAATKRAVAAAEKHARAAAITAARAEVERAEKALATARAALRAAMKK